MAYEYEELENMALKAIIEHKLPKITYVVAYLPCAMSTFYDKQLEKSEILKAEIYKNVIERKIKLINKMEQSDSASAQIAILKLYADEEEFSRLSGQNINHTNNGESFDCGSASTEELLRRAEASRAVEDAS